LNFFSLFRIVSVSEILDCDWSLYNLCLETKTEGMNLYSITNSVIVFLISSQLLIIQFFALRSCCFFNESTDSIRTPTSFHPPNRNNNKKKLDDN